MFKKKVTTKKLSELVIKLSIEYAPSLLSKLEDELASVGLEQDLINRSKAKVDITIAIISMEILVAHNLVSEKIAVSLEVEVVKQLEILTGDNYKNIIDKYLEKATQTMPSAISPMSSFNEFLIINLYGTDISFDPFIDSAVNQAMSNATAVVKSVYENYKIID